VFPAKTIRRSLPCRVCPAVTNDFENRDQLGVAGPARVPQYSTVAK
jgi:hypothetical protein